jgi:hypothetical protein
MKPTKKEDAPVIPGQERETGQRPDRKEERDTEQRRDGNRVPRDENQGQREENPDEPRTVGERPEAYEEE